MLLLLLACAEESVPAAAPTWHADVAPIVNEHCGSCHVAGGVAPFSLESYAEAGPMANAMLASVEAGTMPPWSAETTSECEPRFGFKDDPRLSDDDKATLAAWVAAGSPEGDAATAAVLSEAPNLELEGASQRVTPDASYVTSGTSDEFRCFSMDPGLTEPGWLTGLQVVPGNDAVVHHVLVFTDPAAESPTLVGDEGSYECFGGSGLSGDFALIGAWAPGAFPFETPEGSAIRVPAGSRIVMQIHYHPGGTTGDPDTTSVDLRWADDEPAEEAMLVLAGNASDEEEGLLPEPADRDGVTEFRIPAGETAHVETIEYEVDRRYKVFAAGTHMHYLGTDMLVEVDHVDPQADEPATECLVQTPRWDFNWQRAYAYDVAPDDVPRVRGGDTLRLRCTYDNTLANPGTAAALEDAGLTDPIDVYLGEETLDEMCLGVFGLVL